MREYRVKWQIDVEARSPREAAQKAREYQIKLDATADVFKVEAKSGRVTKIDLTENTSEVIGRPRHSYCLPIAAVETIKAALRFALDMKETYYTLAPKNRNSSAGADYNDGNEKLQDKREDVAWQLLNQTFS